MSRPEQPEIPLQPSAAQQIGAPERASSDAASYTGKWTFFRPFDGKTVEVTNYAVTLETDNVDDLTLSDEHTAAKFVKRAAAKPRR